MKLRCNPRGSPAQLTELENMVFAKGELITLREVYYETQI